MGVTEPFANDSTFTGLAFLDSFFNENGTGVIGGDGIRFFNSTINSGLVSLHDPSITFTTGFALKNSQVVGNMSTFINGHGVEFNGVTATDVTIKNTDIAENTGNGVFIIDSAFTDFAIQNSYLGEVLDGMGMQLFAGNGVDGSHGENSTFTGVAFLNSFFNLNGTVGLGGEGIRFFNSTINSGLVSLDNSSVDAHHRLRPERIAIGGQRQQRRLLRYGHGRGRNHQRRRYRREWGQWRLRRRQHFHRLRDPEFLSGRSPQPNGWHFRRQRHR